MRYESILYRYKKELPWCGVISSWACVLHYTDDDRVAIFDGYNSRFNVPVMLCSHDFQ